MFKKILFTLCFGTLLPAVSFAAEGEETGKISDIRVTSKVVGRHHTHIRIEGTYTNKPSCVDSYEFWAVDTDTPHGKAMLSTILAAQATDRTVTFFGTGACHPDEPGMEKLMQISLK